MEANMRNSTNTDLSIFTNNNEKGIKLSDRLNTVLFNAKFFDVLVGYFRLTGFYLLQEKLEDVKEIRILIGLEVDKEIVDLFSRNQSIEKLKDKVRNEFNSTTNDDVKMENGILKLLDWMISGKLKIRLCYEKNVHAKVYIVRKDPLKVPDQFGNLITGSSNFSYYGLEKNIEFNVELKNKNDVEYALVFFDELWNDSTDISTDLLNTIQCDTWMNAHITPYELFLKSLFCFFEEEIATFDHKYSWPEGFMNLQYQEDAVTQARKILAKHGGVLISDVVGLGKTYVAAMLGTLLPGKKLFIVPPVVRENWESVLEDFGYTMRDKVESTGIIDQIAKWDNLDDFKYVFVDEAHHFRNVGTTEFQLLKRICFNKGVILITATPQNNTINDIGNLITLFQDSKNSSVMPDCTDLNSYFSEMRRRLNIAKGTDEYPIVIKEVSNDIRDNVLRHVLIRRTRSEIIKYYKNDLDKQELVFPYLHDPKQVNYMYDDEMEEAFNKTILLLKSFSYARFSPLLYLKDKKLIGSNKARQENMKGFIKTMLIKRLEGSIYAFMESVKRLKYGSEDFLKLYENERIPIGASSKKSNISDLLVMSEDEYEIYTGEKEISTFKPEDFTSDFIKNVKKDDNLLNEIYYLWSKFNIKTRDPKYDELREKLDSLYKNNKIIIFSESADTVNYLMGRLEKDYGDLVISYTGSDSLGKKNYIKYNFDPKYDFKNINDKSILVTTDALSEGINLHKASVMINYDLPWNPTRVMQRTGRINRVGSTNSELYVYNFFPRANVREHLSLEDSIKAKVKMFHELLGEDSKVITDEENIESFDLFDFLMMANKLPNEEEMSSNAMQMTYIQMIKQIKDNDKELFDKIMNLPVKIRTAKSSNYNGMITFIKQGLIKKFMITDGNTSEEIEFEKAIKYLEADVNEKSIPLNKDYFDMLDLNNEYFANSIIHSQLRKIGTNKRESINEKNTKRYINFLLKSQNISVADKEYIGKIDGAIKNGRLNARIYKNIMAAIGNLKNEEYIISTLKNVIDPIYLKERTNYLLVDSLKEEKVIVLSECLVKEKLPNEDE